MIKSALGTYLLGGKLVLDIVVPHMRDARYSPTVHVGCTDCRHPSIQGLSQEEIRATEAEAWRRRLFLQLSDKESYKLEMISRF